MSNLKLLSVITTTVLLWVILFLVNNNMEVIAVAILFYTIYVLYTFSGYYILEKVDTRFEIDLFNFSLVYNILLALAVLLSIMRYQ